MTSEPVELILSISTVKDYIDCGYRYLLKNVWRVPAPPNMDMAVGTAVHAGIEAMHKGLPAPDKATQSALEREVESMPVIREIDVQYAIRDSEIMRLLYLSNLPLFKPTIVEQDFIVRVDGTLVSGRIDAADDDVHDTKTTANLSKFRPERHRVQMSLYRHGYRALTGRWPGRLLLDVITRNGKFKQVEIEPDDRELADVIGVAKHGIMRGEYEPTGALSGQCARCPYSTGVCTFARLD